MHADADLVDGEIKGPPPSAKSAPNGPPKATVARRAQSYSDFHWAIQATFSSGHKTIPRRASHTLIDTAITNEANFIDWYQAVEKELVDIGDDEYMYGAVSSHADCFEMD